MGWKKIVKITNIIILLETKNIVCRGYQGHVEGQANKATKEE